MGHIYTEITLSNSRHTKTGSVRVNALADTGAVMLCIPESVSDELDLEILDTREVTVADGRKLSIPYVGPVTVGFGKRQCFVGALVMGDEVLLGAVPMEDMDLVLNPARQEVSVNPDYPERPHNKVKTLN
jgi:clan AA aspartic protease